MEDMKKDIGLSNVIKYQKGVRDDNFESGIIPLNKFKIMGARKAFDNDMFFDVVSYSDEKIRFVSKLVDYDGITLDFYKSDGLNLMTTTNPDNNNSNTVKCHKTPASTLHRAAMNKIKSINKGK